MIKLGKALLALALLVLVAAVAWWYVFFEQIFGQDVKQASECFYYTTDACAMGNLVGMVGDIPTYSPLPFWSAVALFALGIVMIAAAPRRRR